MIIKLDNRVNLLIYAAPTLTGYYVFGKNRLVIDLTEGKKKIKTTGRLLTSQVFRFKQVGSLLFTE